ncbi:MAG: tetratricopeptide repeat protein [Treponematales bacterium]
MGQAGAFLDRGIAAAVREDWNTAITEFTGALRLDPNYAAAYLLRGKALLASVSEVTGIAENFAGFGFMVKTFTPEERAAAKSALDDLTRAIALNPTANAYSYCGLAYNGLGEYDKAIADHTQAIRLEPDDAKHLIDRGLAYEDKGDYDRAIADYTQAIRLDPDNVDAYYNRDNAYFNGKKDYDRAIADYNQAIRLDPNYANAYNDRGCVYYLKGNHDRAIVDYSEAIRLNPNHTNAYGNRSVAYYAKGQKDLAIRDLEKQLSLGVYTEWAQATLKEIRGW